jgi:transposase
MAAPSPTPDSSAASPRTTPPTPPQPDPAAWGDAGPPDADLPPPDPDAPPDEPARERPRLQQPVRGRRLAPKVASLASPLTPEQRLLVLDAWRRSGLPAGDFAPLVGVSKHTLYAWKRKFETDGPAGLVDGLRGAPAGSRLPEATRRAILMLKEDNPDWGTERIAAVLLRGPALAASPQAVARVLREAGFYKESRRFDSGGGSGSGWRPDLAVGETRASQTPVSAIFVSVRRGGCPRGRETNRPNRHNRKGLRRQNSFL